MRVRFFFSRLIMTKVQCYNDNPNHVRCKIIELKHIVYIMRLVITHRMKKLTRTVRVLWCLIVFIIITHYCLLVWWAYYFLPRSKVQRIYVWTSTSNKTSHRDKTTVQRAPRPQIGVRRGRDLFIFFHTRNILLREMIFIKTTPRNAYSYIIWCKRITMLYVMTTPRRRVVPRTVFYKTQNKRNDTGQLMRNILASAIDST